jgi:hypothetical protein
MVTQDVANRSSALLSTVRNTSSEPEFRVPIYRWKHEVKALACTGDRKGSPLQAADGKAVFASANIFHLKWPTGVCR